MRILIVEDEPIFAEALRRALELMTMAVDVVHDGASALELVTINDYDVVVLDRDIPVVAGDEVARQISRADVSPRILMLTAAHLPDERVTGLRSGADDYLAKPFVLAELEARLWALGRRPAKGDPPTLRIGSVELDPFLHTVTRNGVKLSLSRKEFVVLHLLMSAGGGPLSAEQLLEKAWDENANPFTNSIRVTISSLRRKLGPPYIETVPGVGYRVADDVA